MAELQERYARMHYEEWFKDAYEGKPLTENWLRAIDELGVLDDSNEVVSFNGGVPSDDINTLCSRADIVSMAREIRQLRAELAVRDKRIAELERTVELLAEAVAKK